MPDQVLIDGHVHIYPNFDRARFLTAAQSRLGGATGYLLMTETRRDAVFDELRAGKGVPDGWQAAPFPDDPAALRLHNATGAVVLIAGFQVVTAEGIEVLTVCTDQRLPDGQPLDAVMADLRTTGRPAILPWGFGKWIGRRGQVLAELLNGDIPPGLHLGDNAGRPGLWPEPPLFRAARSRGMAVLPGSDPLPVSGADDEAGCFGFKLNGALSDTAPAQDLAQRLMTLTEQPEVFGKRCGSATFLRRQIQLRLK